jgi:hypothetical protein
VFAKKIHLNNVLSVEILRVLVKKNHQEDVKNVVKFLVFAKRKWLLNFVMEKKEKSNT